MELERKQLLGISGVIVALAGLLVVPLAAERYLGIDAISVAFMVVVFYFLVNLWLKNRRCVK